MGSAVAAHLAKRRKRVLGLEQFPLGHELGASSGHTRIIRKAYFEGVAYVPLLIRAYELWRQLERDTTTALLDLVGLLMVGKPHGELLRGVALSSERYGVDVHELSREELARRFPQTRVLPEEMALFEPDAGIVFPEKSVAAHLQMARARGAELRENTVVEHWERSSSGALHISLAGGDIVEADQLAICAGPWLAASTCDMQLPLRIQRNVQVWFEPVNAAFDHGKMPAFFVEREEFAKPLYGFPNLGEGVKAALHAFGADTDAAALDRDIHVADVTPVREALESFIPGAANGFRFGKACMYALTPDGDFIIDRHPKDDGVVIAGGFSGHGFKFCPVVGEIVADLLDGVPRPDVDFLSLSRFR